MSKEFVKEMKRLAESVPEPMEKWYKGIREISLIGGKNDGQIFYAATDESNGEISIVDWEFNVVRFKKSDEGVLFEFLDKEIYNA